MAGFRLTVTVDGFDKALAYIRRVQKSVDTSQEELALAGLNAAGTIFEKNFDSEGTGFGLGGWADLAESTVQDRERKGFGGEHPILIRYGDLRTITATSLRVAGGSGTFGATDADGRSIRVDINAGTHGVIARATGDKAWNQVPTAHAPARPFWFTTKTVQYAVRKRAVETLAYRIERL